MPTPNLIVTLQAILSATNNLVSPPPYIANWDFGNPTLGATTFYQDPYFQALVGGSSVPLPLLGGKVFLIAVQNLSPSAILQVTHTPFGAAASTCSVGPNGVVTFLIQRKQAEDLVLSLLPE